VRFFFAFQRLLIDLPIVCNLMIRGYSSGEIVSDIYSLSFFLHEASAQTEVGLFTKTLDRSSLAFKNRPRPICHRLLSSSFYLSIRICIEKQVQLILGSMISLLCTSSLESSISRKAFPLSIENESLPQTGGSF